MVTEKVMNVISMFKYDVKQFQKVRAMCLHETKHPSVQFVLAVKAFPLVNNLVSLWIFLGTLEENVN